MSHLASTKSIESPRAKSDSWFTPRTLIEELHREFCFTLDAAGHDMAPASRLIGGWLTGLGLEHRWKNERVYLNCPYSDITPWIEKAHREVINGCPLVVALLPANKTEQPWWQHYVEPFRDGRGRAGFRIETRFLRGRLRHGTPEDPEGVNAESGTFASVLVIWRRA